MNATQLLSNAEYPEPEESFTRARPRKLTEEELARIRPAFLRLVQKKHISKMNQRDGIHAEPLYGAHLNRLGLNFQIKSRLLFCHEGE